MSAYIVCTLFEKHYHFGVAALINSLYKNGFRGDFFCGFKGDFPPWAISAVDNQSIKWKGAKSMTINEGLLVHFLPLQVGCHLANYKADFMLGLIEGAGSEVEGIAYFDPDIIVKCKWEFYEKWMDYGVALVHEVTSNDMPASHPVRKGWEEVAEKCNLGINRSLTSYINSGFCGVSKKNYEFLVLWSFLTEVAIKDYRVDATQFMPNDRTHLFFACDQDALNVAAMCTSAELSEIGPEGMDFTYGGWTMSHAIGSPKPWKKKFLLSALKGEPPSLADKGFWQNAETPIPAYSSFLVKNKQMQISMASFLGRFYRKY